MPISFDDYWSYMVRNTPDLSHCDMVTMDVPTFRDVVKSVFDRAREGMVEGDEPREPVVFRITSVHRAEG